MRRVVCSLIVVGFLASDAAVATSQERPAAGWTEESQPTRYQRSARDRETPVSRDLQREFFGPTADSDRQTAPQAEEPQPVETASEASRRGSFTLSRHGGTAPPAPESRDGVIHAEYEHNSEWSNQRTIQRVSGRPLVDEWPARTSAEDPAPAVPAENPAPPTPQSSTTERTQAFSTTAPAEDAESDAPSVIVKWRTDDPITLQREFTCELVVRNEGAAEARDVELTAIIPDNVDLIAAEPQPEQTRDALQWRIPRLGPGEERIIAVTMHPTQAGEIVPEARVRFTAAARQRFQVAEPRLAIALDGPTEVLVGDAASQVLTISNPGTGVAENVQIEALIPPGLEHVRGQLLVMDLGALHPGEVRKVRLPLAAVKGGAQTVQVVVRGDVGLAEIASADVTVIAPQLAAHIDGPGLRYVGRRAVYTLTVRNDGDVATNNVQLLHRVPEGLELVETGGGARFDENLRLITWHAGRLDAGEVATVDCTFDCDEIGEFTHFVRATSEHGVVSDSQITTEVQGVSSLVMDIEDLEDPVEVGVGTVYEIRITNEGSAPAAAVSLSCELPQGALLKDVTGPTRHVAESDLIVFQPVATLGAKETVTYRVHVTSSVAGNLRFRARLSSASVEEPILKEELTRFYGE